MKFSSSKIVMCVLLTLLIMASGCSSEDATPFTPTDGDTVPDGDGEVDGDEDGDVSEDDAEGETTTAPLFLQGALVVG